MQETCRSRSRAVVQMQSDRNVRALSLTAASTILTRVGVVLNSACALGYLQDYRAMLLWQASVIP